jgi:hypothetical protein
VKKLSYIIIFLLFAISTNAAWKYNTTSTIDGTIKMVSTVSFNRPDFELVIKSKPDGKIQVLIYSDNVWFKDKEFTKIKYDDKPIKKQEIIRLNLTTLEILDSIEQDENGKSYANVDKFLQEMKSSSILTIELPLVDNTLIMVKFKISGFDQNKIK